MAHSKPGTDGLTIQIAEYRFLKVSYRSVVDYKTHTDYLRSAPQFYGQPRHDWVLLNDPEGGLTFAQLIFVFTLSTGKAPGESPHPFALVLPYSGKVTKAKCTRDTDLGLWRIRKSSATK
jgi:hypothetical protein